MKRNKHRLLPVLLLLLVTTNGYTQNLFNGVNIGLKTGVSKLLTEIEPGFSGTINEFNNTFGMSSSLELSTNLGKHWDVGTEIVWSQLGGNTDHPDFSAVDFHFKMKNLVDAPIEYQTNLVGQMFFVSYYFKEQKYQANTTSLNPFLRTGAGYAHYVSQLRYQNPTDGGLIFGKNYGPYKGEDITSVFFEFGGGLKVSFSPHFFMTASASLNFTNYDFLDAVHNYTDNGTPFDVMGLYSDLQIGLFYSFGEFSTRSGQNKSNYLPFRSAK